jgi:spore germination cell wall hydrolase CwlJ-like protein
LFSGPDYLSTGEEVSPTNWGSPDVASDFFKADKALRLAREIQAKADTEARRPPIPDRVVEEAPSLPRATMRVAAEPSPQMAAMLARAETDPDKAVNRVAPEADKIAARAPQGPELTDRDRDLIIRTIAAETSGKTPEESQAIAHVILNRIQSGKFGASPEAVLRAKSQFEPWSNPALANYPMKFLPNSRRYGMGQAALEAALSGDDITGGALNFWGPKAQYALGRKAPGWAAEMPDYSDIGETRFHRPRAEGGEVDAALHMLRRHFDGSDGSFVDPMGNVAIPAAGPEEEQSAVAVDNVERIRAAENAAKLAKEIQSYEASMSGIRQQPQDIQSMTHAPEKPRAPISVEALGKNREFGSAPYDVAGPLSSFAQGAYDMKTLPLYMYPPTAPLGMAIDTAEGVAAGSPTQVAMGALGGPLKVARNVIAPLAVATGVTAPDEAEAGSLERALKAIRAYHGSPHKFDRFDLSKIGTGEGAQAYGHGLYFAGDEDIAKYYRDALTKGPNNMQIDGGQFKDFYNSLDPEKKLKAKIALNMLHGRDVQAAIDWEKQQTIGKLSSRRLLPEDAPVLQEDLMRLRALEDTPPVIERNPGHMYEVGIHADPERLLNWDKPFMGQSVPVQEAVRYAFGPQPLDARIGSNTMDRPGPIHSRLLNEAGVPGIKYLDAGSRGITGDPTHNYVIFDDKLIDINRRYADGGLIEDRALEISRKG